MSQHKTTTIKINLNDIALFVHGLDSIDPDGGIPYEAWQEIGPLKNKLCSALDRLMGWD
jgi:hypothetical protein